MATVKVLPTEEMFGDWLAHPVTQLFRQMLREARDSLRNQWEEGQFQASEPLETAVANAQALGQSRIYKELSEISYENFIEAFDDQEYIRPPSAGPRGPNGVG